MGRSDGHGEGGRKEEMAREERRGGRRTKETRKERSDGKRQASLCLWLAGRQVGRRHKFISKEMWDDGPE